jgi:hypothetical protein
MRSKVARAVVEHGQHWQIFINKAEIMTFN